MKTKNLWLVLSLCLGVSLLGGFGGTRWQITNGVYITGAVLAPKTIEWREGLTLRQTIALAQGITSRAATDRTSILRKTAEGKRDEIRVDLRAVMNGKANDLSIEAEDVIVVPFKPDNRNENLR